jgi:hypothetical protein
MTGAGLDRDLMSGSINAATQMQRITFNLAAARFTEHGGLGQGWQERPAEKKGNAAGKISRGSGRQVESVYRRAIVADHVALIRAGSDASKEVWLMSRLSDGATKILRHLKETEHGHYLLVRKLEPLFKDNPDKLDASLRELAALSLM